MEFFPCVTNCHSFVYEDRLILACGHLSEHGPYGSLFTCKDYEWVAQGKGRSYCLKHRYVCNCFRDCQDGSDEAGPECERKLRDKGLSKNLSHFSSPFPRFCSNPNPSLALLSSIDHKSWHFSFLDKSFCLFSSLWWWQRMLSDTRW